jgi:hypothetical protein
MKSYKYRLRLFFVLLLFGLSVSGCQGKSTYHDKVKEVSSTFLAPMDEKFYSEQKTGPQRQNAHDETLSVHQAVLLSAQRDDEVLAILAELKKAKIDVKDALSHRWPRLDFNSQADFPAHADNNAKTEYTGGAFFKYDLWKAIAVDEEHALRQALVRKEIEKLKIVLNGLSKKILHQISQISLLEYKIEKRKDTLSKVKTAYEVVKVYAQQHQADSTLVHSWKSRVDTLGFDLKKSEHELLAMKQSLAHMAGLSDVDNMEISDREAVLASYFSLSETAPAPSEIWSKHSEARLAEVEYIAAEVNVKLVQMENWPRLQTFLGLGNVPLTGKADTTASLLQVSLSLPLWDMGDSERKVAKAEITRNFIKSRLHKKAYDLTSRAKEAGYLFHMARANYQDLDGSFQEMNERLQGESILLTQNRINAPELTLVQLNVAEADILRQEALAKVQEAGGNFRFSTGEDVINGEVPSVLENLLHQHAIIDEARNADEEILKKNVSNTLSDEVR